MAITSRSKCCFTVVIWLFYHIQYLPSPLCSSLCFTVPSNQICNYPHSRVLVNVKLRCGELFSLPGAIDSSNKKASYIEAFTGLLLRPSVLAEAAGSCHWRFIRPEPRMPPTPHYPIPMPSITATSWHMLTVTSWLIASSPMKQRAMTDVSHAPPRWVSVKQRWHVGDYGRFILFNSLLSLSKGLSNVFFQS